MPKFQVIQTRRRITTEQGTAFVSVPCPPSTRRSTLARDRDFHQAYINALEAMREAGVPDWAEIEYEINGSLLSASTRYEEEII